MRISEEIDYFKNELKSYTHLIEKVKELKIEQKKEISKREEKIAEIKDKINNAWIESPKYDQVSFSSKANNDKVLNLINKEEQLKEEISELQKDYDFSIKSYLDRKDYIEKLLEQIDDEEKQIISGLYFNRAGYNVMCNKLSYTRDGMYKKVNKIIKKMIKNSKKKSEK